ncbi:hypothetical protein OSB04_014850 [Centaurea solstitialis]|uniref:LisH domain-containing protein n=1 Tax=Centaurea solstitialis TaxID=347529 RepID=A0AA38WFZ3_9ASTR|nr:hypothetical protein OSB04_014850 [Centaurea solstitialis]
MLHHLHTKNLNNTETAAISSNSLFAFKPRQVSFAEHNNNSRSNNKKMNDVIALKEGNSAKITSFTPELKASLHHSILDYLHRHGFSKTLKRFQSEAEIQGDTWKASSLHLEDVFCKYNACDADSNLNTSKKPGNLVTFTLDMFVAVLGNGEAIIKDTICATKETISKKKKKKGAVESDNGVIEDESNVTNKKITESGKNCGQASEDVVNEPETKPKKKKTKHDDELVAEVAEKEGKKKKKKKSSTESAAEDNQVKTTQPDASRKEKESSKKRKRSSSDDNENPTTEITITEESKHQKTETSKIAQETSNEHANGKLEISGGEKSGAQKSAKKQRKDSTEPKTVNAFQRVKIDEVEFAHQKLTDNSYWAKDGADIGYGAKAQEVLGQVRGRDFRHEKTKKKRGSYRGGLIDQQSHSIKFNYSDEE